MGSKLAWKVTFAFFCSPMIWQDIFFLIDYVFWKYLVISCMKIKIRYHWLYCATSNVTMGFWINSIRSILFYASVTSRDMSSVLVQTTTWVNHKKLVKTLGEKIGSRKWRMLLIKEIQTHCDVWSWPKKLRIAWITRKWLLSGCHPSWKWFST